MKKRFFSMLLAIVMVVGLLPTAVFAAEGDNLCDHHTEHTADCGYAPAVEGSPCTHECGEECAEACTHTHDALCGYVEAAAEVPCGYVCEESHGEATRVIYVDESTFLASGYSRFYDANENLLTATREEQEDGWVKYTMPADAKYYLTFDGHMGGGGGGNYPELPTDADTYDPFSDTWSCSHPGYAEGNCRLCGEPCPGHTYDNACDDKCNVCSEIREVGDHVYDGAEDAECNECGYVRDITPTQITGVSITVDGVTYTEGDVTITPATESVIFTVTGTHFENLSIIDHVLSHAPQSTTSEGSILWTTDAAANTATVDFSGQNDLLEACDHYEVMYSNDGGESWTGTGIYLTYDDGTGGEEDTTPAEITGVSITVDGVEYTTGNVTITPTSTITLTITGTNLKNGTEDHRLDYAGGLYLPVTPDYFEISEDGTVATYEPSTGDFANSSNFEITYCNNDTDTANRTVVPTGIYLTYDDGIAEEDRARITGMSITIDGVVYDSSNTSAEDPAVITPNTGFITITVHGTSLQNCTVDHVVSYYSGSSEPILANNLWQFEADGTSAYHYYSSASALSDFARNTTPYELQYSNNGSFNAANPAIGSGVYIVYDDSTGGEEDTTLAEITGISITVDGETYTSGNVTITPTSTVTFTITGTNLQNGTEDHRVNFALGAGLWATPDYCDVSEDGTTATFAPSLINFTSCSNYEVVYYNNYTDDINRAVVSSGIYLTYDDGTGGEEDTTPAEITGVSINVDGETYTSGDVTITPDTQSIIVTVTGTHFANLSDDNVLDLGPGLTIFMNSFRWKIDSAANTATADFSDLNSEFGDHNGSEIMYSNGGGQGLTGTGIYLTYDDGTGGEENTTPDSTGKILVDVQDSYGDGWNGAAIDIYKNGSLEQTVTVDKTSNTVFLDYDSTATYEFKWIKGDYDYECSFTIYEDGEEKLSVTDASVYENGETIWPQGDTGGEGGGEGGGDDTTPAEITGVSITVDGVTYTSGDVTITPTSTITLTVTGTNLLSGTGDNHVDYADGLSEPVEPGYFEINEDGTVATYELPAGDFANSSHFEIKYCNNYTDIDNRTVVPTGIYLTYDDSTGGEEDTTPAEITGVSISVDGVTYTEGDVTITPDTQSIIVTVTGTHFANLSDDNVLELGPGLTIFMNSWRWEIDSDANTATADFSDLNSEFGDHNGTEIMYSNDSNQNWTDTGIYLTYDDGTGGEEDGAPIITQQPTDSSAKLGDRFCVEVIARGEGLKYQWYWRQVGTTTWHVSGQRDNTYDDVMTEARHNREVYCVITDSHGNSVTTETACLTAIKTVDLAITKEPEDVTVHYGERFTVTAEAVGEGVTYEWYYLDPDGAAWLSANVRSATYSGKMSEKIDGRAVYCVARDLWGNQVATGVVSLLCQRAELAITKQPNDSSAKLDEMFCVEVLAEGDGLKYQWYFRKVGAENWTVSGQRDNTYDDVMTSARHNREVYCVITDAWGNSVTTEIATITGTPTTTLAITRQPESQSVTIGDMFNVTFEAQGDGLKYQWYFRQAGTEVWYTSGQRDNSYDDVMTKARHNRELYCVVTDAWGNTVETDPIVVILATPRYELAITAQPENESAKLGEMFCVTVEAQGDELRYQWYWRNVGSETWHVSGQRDNTYDDVMTKARHNREVKCVITDMWGNSVETGIATITGIPTQTLAIIQQPTDGHAKMGEGYFVEVIAQGDGLQYQWYFRNAGASNWNKSGVTDNTYDDVMTKARAGREVYCVVTDAWGHSVTTDTVTLVCD